MRRSLRYQIMLPTLGLMITTLIGVTIWNAQLAAGHAKREIERQLAEIIRTLDQSHFPLTDSVLRQMKGLSGAEFVLVGDSGPITASSTDLVGLERLPRELVIPPDFVLRDRISLDRGTYFHCATRLRQRGSDAPQAVLHVLYPESGYREAWMRAVLPPMAIGLVAMIVAVCSAVAVAARVSRPITRLQVQVQRIAEGDFEPLPLPQRPDEIRDLAKDINQMALKLAQYEREVRQTERLRTLAQVGGGIAHQLRNAATGCRMAIDILADERALPADCESLSVARQQLELMERYLQRFLSTGQPEETVDFRPTELARLVDDLLPLVRPAARHAGVQLKWERPGDCVMIPGDREGLEQLMVNLLLNGIEAAANANQDSKTERSVQVRVNVHGTQSAELVVQDSGPGPSEQISADLFEPFVTAKADGVGLGLSVARQVARQHGGRITWDRHSGATCFRVTLPLLHREHGCVELAGRR